MRVLFLLGAVMAMCNVASGDYLFSINATNTVYSTTLNFDEPGGPTGNTGTGDFASFGITSLNAGDGVPVVGDFGSGPFGSPWLGTDNSFFGNFGVFIEYDSDLIAFASQVQDPSGPPSPFGGGTGVFLFDDGVEVANFFFEPAWGGLGDEFLDITATNGDAFDEVRILGFGFPFATYVDDLSWNVNTTAIPEPGSAMLMGALGLSVLVRRRNR